MYSHCCIKNIYITFFFIWFYNFQYSQDVHFMFTIFSLVQKNYQNFVFKKHLILILTYNEKSGIYLFCNEGYTIYIQIKIIVIENQLKKKFKFIFYTIVWKTKLSGVGFIRLDSGREPGLESDMYTVQARSKICPCVPPCTLSIYYIK